MVKGGGAHMKGIDCGLFFGTWILAPGTPREQAALRVDQGGRKDDVVKGGGAHMKGVVWWVVFQHLDIGTRDSKRRWLVRRYSFEDGATRSRVQASFV